MAIERLQSRTEQNQQLDQECRDNFSSKKRGIGDFWKHQCQLSDPQQQCKGKELALTEEEDTLIGEDGKHPEKQIVLSECYVKDHPGLAGGAGGAEIVQRICSAMEAMLKVADKLAADPVSRLVVTALNTIWKMAQKNKENKDRAAMNAKLDKLLHSPYEIALSLLDKANTLKASNHDKDIKIREDSLFNAALNFMSASNNVDDGFIKTLSMFYAGVCYDLLGTSGTHNCAMDEYNKAYTNGHALWNESVENMHFLCCAPPTGEPGANKMVDQLVDFYQQLMEPLKRIVENYSSTSDNAASTSKFAVGDRKYLTLKSIPRSEGAIKNFCDSAKIRCETRQYKEAIDDYSRALALYGGNNANALRSRGEARRLLGQYDNALHDFTDSLKIEPNHGFTLGKRGLVYQAMGQDKKALADFNLALRFDSSQAWIKEELNIITGNEMRQKSIQRHYDSGMRHLQTGRYEESWDYFHRVIIQDGNHAWARARRGAAYMGMKQYDDALTDFNLALKLDGDHTAWTCAHRGIMHRKMGQYEKARDDLSQALKLDSPPAWIKEELEETNKRIKIYNLGMDHLKVGRYEDARTSFTQVIDKDKDHAWARARRGAAYMGMRRFDDALADFNQALELDGDHAAWTLGHRGIMHRKMQQYKDAWTDLSQAHTLDSSRSLTWIKEELEKLGQWRR
jgi:tetratricopeptide (TPR) repeat protein